MKLILTLLATLLLAPLVALHVKQLLGQAAHTEVDPPSEYAPAAQVAHDAPPYPASHDVHRPDSTLQAPGDALQPPPHTEQASSVPPTECRPAVQAAHDVPPYPASHVKQVPVVASHVPGPELQPAAHALHAAVEFPSE